MRLFEEPIRVRKPKQQDKLKLILKQLSKELELTKPMSQRELFDTALDEIQKVVDEFIAEGVSKDVILWAMGNMMKKYMEKMDNNATTNF